MLSQQGYYCGVRNASESSALGFDQVSEQGIAVKGSIVGSRLDMMEALDMAARGLVKAHVMMQPVEKVNEVMQEMMENKVCGRIVLEV